CEGISALRNGTGLIGLWRSILFGQNVPRPIATDYQAELAGQAPSPPPPALSSTHTIKPIPPHQPTNTKP
ncbi:MAG: hypothetical protein LBK99_21305, partial [Opitutaceae bacterium]|nr:hypothetical protein [Opitutaceae bacterium]